MIMVALFTGCRDKNTDSHKKANAEMGNDGYIYVPQYIDLSKNNETLSLNNIMIQNNNLFYTVYNWDETTGDNSQKIYKQDLNNLNSKIEAEEIPISLNGNLNIIQYLADDNDNLILLLAEYPPVREGEEASYGLQQPTYYLSKYDKQGNQLLHQDITSALSSEQGNAGYIQTAAIDSLGRIYVSYDQSICLFNSDGQSHGKISTNDDWISGMGVGRDGHVYASFVGSGSKVINKLFRIDFDKKILKNNYANVPQSRGFIATGLEKSLLINDGIKLYEYDLETQTAVEVLDWSECKINGDFVEAYSVTEDDKIIAIIRDWSGENTTTELVSLKKAVVSEVTQKEIILIGTLRADQSLQKAAVNFNKNNDKYIIKIKEYIDYNAEWTENKYMDGVTMLNNDIISGNGPDIISLSGGIDLKDYANKGLLEDLQPYLDNSTELTVDNFLENIIQNFTFEDNLICIPGRFRIQTAVGKTSLVGDKKGWNFEDANALTDTYPDASFIEYSTKDNMLYNCLYYNIEFFMDYENGKCNFNSDEFKQILDFVNRFPKEGDWNDPGRKSTLKQLQDDELLLNHVSFHSVVDYQANGLMCGESSNYIGFPTVDGRFGSKILIENGAYAISSKSNNKDGAWSFIEDFLINDIGTGTDIHSSFDGFSTQKWVLNQMFEEAMTDDVVTDLNGEPVLNEDGTVKIQPKKTWRHENWNPEIYAANQEQIDDLKEIISQSSVSMDQRNEVIDIVVEEVSPYFEGQKSMDEVISIIQSRIQIYISENS